MSAPADFCPDSWALISCQGETCSHLANLDEDLREAIETAAKEYLWRWSGRRFGLCEVAVRPCVDGPGRYGEWFTPSNSGLVPYIKDGNWYNATCGGCRSQRCSCNDVSTIVLPGQVYDVTGVWIDGEVLDPAAYRLDNLGLSRVDGGFWPRCQNMTNPPLLDEESPDVSSTADTFLVTYRIGSPVPSGGQLAAGTLACELAKQSCAPKECRLPRRATTVAREGVTIVMPTDEQLFANGVTGIFEIDSWLASVQHENRTGYKVTSPDVKRFRSRW